MNRQRHRLAGLITLLAAVAWADGTSAQAVGPAVTCAPSVAADLVVTPGAAALSRPQQPPACAGVAWPWRAGPSAPQRAEPRHPATPMLLSLAVPGVGQRLLGQRRGWAYLALEALGWGLWLDRRRAAAEVRDEYRDLAWDRARIQSGPRVDGSFGYYETLSKWTRSGSYDVDAATPGLQPETDRASYNGSIWALARGLFLGGVTDPPASSPEYQSALAYYRERAYGEAFLWDWTGAGAAREEFGALIVRSDDRFRQATNVLGAVLANHVISSVDAYLSARGRSSPVRLRVASAPSEVGSRWLGWLRIELPR